MNMRNIATLLMIIACLTITSCTGKIPPAQGNTSTTVTKTNITEQVNFTKDTYPIVDGSTATIPLSESYAAKLLNLSKDDATKFVKHNKTHDAYVNLVKGTANIIFVTEPSMEELKIAKDANVELEVVPIIKEGFVFMVNNRNAVKNISTQQIQDVYQGKIKNWKQLGGKDKEIIAYQRESNSGSQTLMEQLVMKGLKLIDEPKTVVQGMGELIEEVASYENSEKSIGYSVYYFAKTMYVKDNINLLSIDGVAPDNATISQGKYPFVTAYYAVIKKTEALDSPARKLLNWALSSDGQNVSEATGYVPLEAR